VSNSTYFYTSFGSAWPIIIELQFSIYDYILSVKRSTHVSHRFLGTVVVDKLRWPHFANFMTHTFGDPSRHNVAICTELLPLIWTHVGVPNFFVPAEYFFFKSYLFLYVPPGLTLKHSTWFSLCVECFVRISEQTAAFALYSISWLVFITMVESVYSAVRAVSLYKTDHV